MKDCAIAYLVKKGYTVNQNALAIVKMCDDWYSNRNIENFHVRENLNGAKKQMKRMNFAKRCCADDANLCEIISVVPEKDKDAKIFIEQLLQENRFEVRYREQLEKTSATGTVGAYIYLSGANYIQQGEGKISVKGGKVRINYVDADCIIPLTVENKMVTECAFCATNIVKGKERTTLVVFTKESNFYTADTIFFDEKGEVVKEAITHLQLGSVKPFSIMCNAEVNNLDNMEGYGLPKIYNNIPLLMAMDLCYNLLYGDLSKADKLIFLNELLACVQRDEEGKAYLTAQQKEIFILLGEDGGKLPEEKTLVQEYNPEIRIEQITKAFELTLSLLSMNFGYGTKKYTFENGQIKTATEYIGAKQDSMQELNKQRKQAKDYITDIVHAAMWFSNQFLGSKFNENEKISVEFDDSYIVDRETELERVRNDAITFEIPELLTKYLVDAYGYTINEVSQIIGKVKANGELEEKED